MPHRREKTRAHGDAASKSGKVKILFLGTRVFFRIIRHLLEDQDDFEAVASTGGLKNIGPLIARLDPKLIVVDVKPIGTNIRCTVLNLKRSSPLSKLILICPCSDLAEAARDCGADACLEPDKLVRGFLPLAATLSIPRRFRLSKRTEN